MTARPWANRHGALNYLNILYNTREADQFGRLAEVLDKVLDSVNLPRLMRGIRVRPFPPRTIDKPRGISHS